VHVPYRGAGPAIADLLGGQIPMSVTAVNGQLLELHRTGRLRILTVTSPNRLRVAPDLPTVSDAGMPQLAAQATTWLFVPKGTPARTIAGVLSPTLTYNENMLPRVSSRRQMRLGKQRQGSCRKRSRIGP
jgi:tripartite-type tricarboxylate transporter receptor subunit TctC